MPLEPYRRHNEDCPHITKGIGYTKCKCRIWAYGDLHGEPFRRSLGTRDWVRALDRIRRLEETAKGEMSIPDIDEAVAAFLRDCEARKLKPTTLEHYRRTLGLFSASVGELRTERLGVDHIATFRVGRKIPGDTLRDISAATSRKELQTLRTFCSFCVDRNWLAGNPARRVKPPKEISDGATPYTAAEITALLAACAQLGDDNPNLRWMTRRRARALLLAFLYTGFRISDIAALKWTAIVDGYLTIRQVKNDAPVKLLLNPMAATAINELPKSGEYVFWSGNGDVATCIKNLRRTVYRVAKLAGVDAYPHRFRDTFACFLLAQGVDIRTVSLLLGHRSIRTTEKHYAHFVSAHQANLDRATSGLNFKAS